MDVSRSMKKEGIIQMRSKLVHVELHVCVYAVCSETFVQAVFFNAVIGFETFIYLITLHCPNVALDVILGLSGYIRTDGTVSGQL